MKKIIGIVIVIFFGLLIMPFVFHLMWRLTYLAIGLVIGFIIVKVFTNLFD